MNNILKYLRVSINLIENLNLDLSNLNILTECASNAYAFTPIISCLAGAKSVIVGVQTLDMGNMKTTNLT